MFATVGADILRTFVIINFVNYINEFEKINACIYDQNEIRIFMIFKVLILQLSKSNTPNKISPKIGLKGVVYFENGDSG